MTTAEEQQQDVRKRLVATAVLELEGVPLNLRRPAMLKLIEAFANQLIAEYPGMTVADFSAIFTKDNGLGPIGDEITAALSRLEAGAGAVEREALVALAKGTRLTDRDKGA